VLAGEEQGFSQVQQTFAVQFEPPYSCSAGRGSPNNMAERFTPFEMLFPFVFARVKKRHFFTRQWVGGLCMYVFMVVATLAGESEIGEFILTAFSARNNMLQRKGVR